MRSANLTTGTSSALARPAQRGGSRISAARLASGPGLVRILNEVSFDVTMPSHSSRITEEEDG